MTDIEAKIYPLIAAWTTGEPLIWSNQNAPRPAIPYWTLNSVSEVAIGDNTYDQGTNDIDQMFHRGVRESVIQVQRIGEGSTQIIANLRENLARISTRESWYAENVALFLMGAVNDVPFLLDGNSFEPRATLDLSIRYGKKQADTLMSIEVISADGTYDGAVVPGSLDETVTIVLHP